MALENDINTKEDQKFVESPKRPNKPAVAVVNPDGSDVASDTVVKQETLISLIETLQELNQRLTPLGGAVANTAQLRVIQTTVPSTAVTGPLTNAQYIATPVVGGIHYTQRTAMENLAAIYSNVNNVAITI